MSGRRAYLEWSGGAAAPVLAALAAGEPAGWRDFALCAETDPEVFFPEKGGSTRDAKGVCRACPVRAECLQYALEHDERFGIWGGLSERQRRDLRRHGVLLVADGDGKKTCSKCAETKPLSEFHQRHGHRTSRYESRCKACRREDRRERWAERAA